MLTRTRNGLVMLVLTIAPGVLAQPCTPPETRARIRVGDNGTNQQSLWFGFHVNATVSIDTGLCEFEMPPAPPTGVFDARFAGFNLGQGTYEDYRPYLGPADIDTHKIKFQSEDVGLPVTFRWDSDSVQRICDSAIVTDEFGGIIIRVNMIVDSQAVVSSPSFSTILIIRYGQRLLVTEAPIGSTVKEFSLSQNYPNPFNPKTIIKYQQPINNWVTLRVFDVLGRDVATLVNASKEPGTHSIEWDASGQSSGVYFYRLTTGAATLTKKMLLVR